MQVEAWQRLVSDQTGPLPPGARRAQARVAAAKLSAMERALEGSISRPELLALLANLSPGRSPLSAADLDDPKAFLDWLAQLFGWREGAPMAEILGPNPPRDFHARVADGREDQLELESERVSAWVHLHQFGDGHQDLFWDPTFVGGVRILKTDNREEEVIAKEWLSADAFLTDWFLPQLLIRHRAAVAEAARSPAYRLLRDVVTLGVIAVLLVGCVVVFGLALRGCGVIGCGVGRP